MIKPQIINNCAKSYRIDHQRIIDRIIDRIPSEYLVTLEEVIFVCKDNHPRMKYISGKNNRGLAKIEVNLNYADYNKLSLISIFSINMDFIAMIHEHIETAIKPVSRTSVIRSRTKGTIEFRWMYLGAWSPLFYLLFILSYPIKKIVSIHTTIFQLMSRMVMGSKSDKD